MDGTYINGYLNEIMEDYLKSMDSFLFVAKIIALIGLIVSAYFTWTCVRSFRRSDMSFSITNHVIFITPTTSIQLYRYSILFFQKVKINL